MPPPQTLLLFIFIYLIFTARCFASAVLATAILSVCLSVCLSVSSIALNKNSTLAFQRAISQGSTPPLTASKWG